MTRRNGPLEEPQYNESIRLSEGASLPLSLRGVTVRTKRSRICGAGDCFAALAMTYLETIPASRETECTLCIRILLPAFE